MTSRDDRSAQLREILRERIVVFDGAMGTAIHALDLSIDEFGGPALENCNENLNLRRPDLIRGIHEAYLEAGADIVETNSFNGSPDDMREFGLKDQAYELNFAAAKLAREAADEYSTAQKPRFVAGAMGPTRKPITLTPGVRFDGLVADYHDHALALAEGGADLLLLETGQDTRNIKAGLIGIGRVFDEVGYRLPVIVSGTIEPMGDDARRAARGRSCSFAGARRLVVHWFELRYRAGVHDRPLAHDSSHGAQRGPLLPQRGVAG